ncbi:hypothetical protein ABZ876_27140 [Streptomyces sp. NPDC046931]|uniref:hypothetical protein n=1 Tax=Streptomyces sp. NPDC046931 TaxID=3154806 RepID=UPI0033D25212
MSEEGAAAFFLAWQTYRFAAAGSLSLVLLGCAMRGGPLIASQPALTLGDASVSFCLGIVLYSEWPRHGLWLLPAFLGLALLCYGVFALSRTRCLTECVNLAADEARHEEQPASAALHRGRDD